MWSPCDNLSTTWRPFWTIWVAFGNHLALLGNRFEHFRGSVSKKWWKRVRDRKNDVSGVSLEHQLSHTNQNKYKKHDFEAYFSDPKNNKFSRTLFDHFFWFRGGPAPENTATSLYCRSKPKVPRFPDKMKKHEKCHQKWLPKWTHKSLEVQKEIKRT